MANKKHSESPYEQLPLDGIARPWEKLPEEPDDLFYFFSSFYLKLPPKRTLLAAYIEYTKKYSKKLSGKVVVPKEWHEAHKVWMWKKREKAFDEFTAINTFNKIEKERTQDAEKLREGSSINVSLITRVSKCLHKIQEQIEMKLISGGESGEEARRELSLLIRDASKLWAVVPKIYEEFRKAYALDVDLTDKKREFEVVDTLDADDYIGIEQDALADLEKRAKAERANYERVTKADANKETGKGTS